MRGITPYVGVGQMRTLERNKRTIHYAQLIGSTPIKDEYGNETGEYANEYPPPVPLQKSTTLPAKGEYTNAQFGGIKSSL